MNALDFVDSPPATLDHGIVVIYGDEGFLRQKSVEIVRRLALGGDDAFGWHSVSGAVAQLADVLDELATTPMFAGRRVIAIEEADDFISTHRAALERYVAAPSRRNVLVLLPKSFPSNTRLAKAAVQKGLVLECKAPRPGDVVRWAVRWCTQAHGKKLSRDAADALVERVGPHLGMIDRELEKISAGVAARREITADDVEALTAVSAETTAWQMIDAVAEGRVGESLRLLSKLLTAGEAPVAILGALSWHCRMLARAGRLAESGRPLSAAMEEAGVKPFAAQRTGGHLRRLGRKRIDLMYGWLLDADLDLKGRTNAPAQVVLETLLLRLAGNVV